MFYMDHSFMIKNRNTIVVIDQTIICKLCTGSSFRLFKFHDIIFKILPFIHWTVKCRMTANTVRHNNVPMIDHLMTDFYTMICQFIDHLEFKIIRILFFCRIIRFQRINSTSFRRRNQSKF